EAAERIGAPVIVQQMVKSGTELLAGIVQDPTFGPLVAFGPGGVLAELIGEAGFRIAPLTDVDAEELLAQEKTDLLVAGYRGAPAPDTAALTDLLHRLSRLGEDLPEVAELDLNPVIAGPEGCVVVDARARVRRPPERRRVKTWERRSGRFGGPREDDQHAQALVPREPVIGSGRDERRLALADLDRVAFDLENAPPLEHDVHLVVSVRLLPVRLRSDEHVDTDLEPGRLVDDLVPAAGLLEPAPGRLDVQSVHTGTRTRRRRRCRRALAWARTRRRPARAPGPTSRRPPRPAAGPPPGPAQP